MQCPNCFSTKIYRTSPEKCVCQNCLNVFESQITQKNIEDKINLSQQKKIKFRYKLYGAFFIAFTLAVIFSNIHHKFFSPPQEVYIKYEVLHKEVTKPPYSYTTYYLLIPEEYKERIDYLFREGRLCNESPRSRSFCDAIIWLDNTDKPTIFNSLNNSDKESIYAIYDGSPNSFYCHDDGYFSVREPCTLEKVNDYFKN